MIFCGHHEVIVVGLEIEAVVHATTLIAFEKLEKLWLRWLKHVQPN